MINQVIIKWLQYLSELGTQQWIRLALELEILQYLLEVIDYLTVDLDHEFGYLAVKLTLWYCVSWYCAGSFLEFFDPKNLNFSCNQLWFVFKKKLLPWFLLMGLKNSSHGLLWWILKIPPIVSIDDFKKLLPCFLLMG